MASVSLSSVANARLDSPARPILFAPPAGESVAGCEDPEARSSSYHKTAVAEIVGMIRAKLSSEGERNFAIGKRVLEHAQWQRGNFPNYEPADLDRLMSEIAEEVQADVAISAESIRIGEWLRCHVLRSLVSEAAGDVVADALSFFEYRSLYGKALLFSKRDVEGELVAGWLDFVKRVAGLRATGKRVTSKAFLSMVADHERALASANAEPTMPNPANKAESEKRQAARKANEAVTTAVSQALQAKHLDGPAIMTIVETVAKTHGVPLPPAFGFDAAGCTVADCDLLSSTMFQAGKYAEMVALRNRLDKMLAAVEKARKSHTDRQAATA